MQRARIPFALALVLFLAGCATERLPRVFWPLPPEEPRIEWVGTYASQDDFPKTAAQKNAELVIGKPPLAKFRTPFGIVGDGQGKVYISDMHDANVRVYDLNERTVDYYFKESPVSGPRGLAMDAAGDLYLVDMGRKAVLVFSPPQQTISRLIGGPEYFRSPVFLAINPRLSRLYVSDSQGHRIQVFDLQGTHLFTIGGKAGAAEGALYYPQGLAIAADDRLFVADTLNARIQVFDADGNFLYTFGTRGDQFNQFEMPKDLAFDSDGNLWIVDNRRTAIYTYTPDGKPLLVTGGGQATRFKLGFAKPVSVAIDASDRIYITDMTNKRFSVWQYLSPEYLGRHPIEPEDREWAREVAERMMAAEGEKSR